MPEDQDDSNNQQRKTFYDIARPGTTPSSATSRPLVVGHGVSQSDPMMRKADNDPFQPATDDMPSAPEVASDEPVDAPINPNSIPLDSADESTVTETAAAPESEQTADQAEVQPPEPEEVANTQSETAAPAEQPVVVEAASVAADEPLPVRGPAADPQKLLPDHTEETPVTKRKPKRSKVQVVIISILVVLVVAALALDAFLLLEYLKLRT
jgi:cobalamin biosynthesis Mg chelatase CobN